MVRRAVVAGGLLVAALGAPQAVAQGEPAAPRPVVVAVVDGGLNAYHAEFRDPRRAAPPWTDVPGYPGDAAALRLSLHAPDFESARERDDRLWRALQPGRLYWLPGTKVVGLVHLPGDALDRANEINVDTSQPDRDAAVIDSAAHGTPVASLAVGNTLGRCPDCLLVHVAASDQAEGLAWAASQPWIDVVSNSWGDVSGPVPLAAARSAADASHAAHRSGKVVVFASGNGTTGASPYVGGGLPDRGVSAANGSSGPPWVVAVGGHARGRPTGWHNVPVDVLAEAQDVPAAAGNSLTGTQSFFGTSAAAPAVAGVAAEALRLVRSQPAAARRPVPAGALAATPRGQGPRSDGVLTQDELVSALLRSAQLPDTGDPFLVRGWGLADLPGQAGVVADALLGRRVLAPRPDDEAEHARMHSLRTALWGPA